MNDDQKILIYATKIFLENGFYKTSMDQLASGMKISKKTIYKFFPSKNLLLEKVVETFANKIKTDVEEIVKSDECLIKKLRQLGTYLARFYLNLSEKFLSDFANHQPELWKKLDSFRTNILEDIWNILILEGKKGKLIIDSPNAVILIIVQSSIRGIISPEFMDKSGLSPTQAFEEMFTIIMRGILTEKGKKEFDKQEWT